jgi:hypothetical protein
MVTSTTKVPVMLCKLPSVRCERLARLCCIYYHRQPPGVQGGAGSGYIFRKWQACPPPCAAKDLAQLLGRSLDPSIRRMPPTTSERVRRPLESERKAALGACLHV